jgi:hypothetical protein
MRRRVIEALDRLVDDPPAGDVRKLQGSDDEWRLRVGDWCIASSVTNKPASFAFSARSIGASPTGIDESEVSSPLLL